MKFTIDLKVLHQLNLSPDEFVWLKLLELGQTQLLNHRFVDIKKLQALGYLTESSELKAGVLDIDKDVTDSTKKEFEAFVETYRSIFPKGVEAAPGHPARGDKQGCIIKLKKFFRNYPEYSKEDVLEATKYYVHQKSLTGFNRIQTAHYFIEREGVSTLASLCETIKSRKNPVAQRPSGFEGTIN